MSLLDCPLQLLLLRLLRVRQVVAIFISVISVQLFGDTRGGGLFEALPVGGREDRLEPLVDVALKRFSDG